MDKRNETVMETRRREYAAAGVKPLEWRLYPIESISDGSRLGYLSKLFVNSLKLGVIAPETYEPSTAATLRGAKLAMWQLEETRRLFTRLAEEGRELPLVVISMSLKMFLGKTAKRAFSDFLSELSATEAGKICFAFTGEVLFMDAGDLNLKLEEAREKGLKTALVGYGEEYCPPLRLKGLKFDYIFFAPEFSCALERREADARALAGLADAVGFVTVAQLFKSGKYFQPESFPLPEDDYPADYFVGGTGIPAESLFGEDSA